MNDNNIFIKNHIFKLLLISSLLFLSYNNLSAQSSDNGDGTFRNPVIWGDFPDPDVIRAGDTYYMISTSMQYFPGVTLLKSKDLVNWGIASNVVDEFKEHPFYDMNGGTRYAKGQWATSLRYFNKKFYILFTTLKSLYTFKRGCLKSRQTVIARQPYCPLYTTVPVA